MANMSTTASALLTNVLSAYTEAYETPLHQTSVALDDGSEFNATFDYANYQDDAIYFERKNY